MTEFSNIIRKDLQNFTAYSSARKESKAGHLFLNANESPWDETGLHLNRYPEPQPQLLLETLAALYAVPVENILVTRGSDEGIDLLTRLCCQAGQDAVLSCMPSFGMYAVSAQLQNATFITVPLLKEEDFEFSVERVLAALTPEVKLVFLCSPNNPTGNLIKESDITKLCETLAAQALVVVDEAYLEYAESTSAIVQQKKHQNLVVLKTLSKAYGLAAVRCGVVIAHPQLIAYLNRIIAPYPVPLPTQQAVLKKLSVENLKKIATQITCVKQEKIKLEQILKKLLMVKKYWPSEGNFLLVEFKDAKKVFQMCLEQGVVLRDMSNKPHLENCLRISIGTADENLQLINVLKNLDK